MYYFELANYKIPVFWKENGLPLFIGNKRISSRRLVWWMPTNWIAVPVLFVLGLPLLLRMLYANIGKKDDT